MLKRRIESILRKIGLYETLIAVRNKRRYRRLLNMERKINLDMFNADESKRIEEQLRVRIHALEKICVIGSIPIHGNIKLSFDILTDIETLVRNGKDTEADVIIEGFSAINLYATICKESKMDCFEIEKKAASLLRDIGTSKGLSEYRSIDIIHEKPQASQPLIDIKEFMASRVSIRESKPEIISADTIFSIVDLANRCPSAANRQPCKVFFTLDAHKRDKLKAACGDKQVSLNIHNFLVPTVDKTAFSRGEFFQAWLNGGIFVDSLINSLHVHDLGSCIFQTIKGRKNTAEIKTLLEIPDNEDILCVVGFGKYPDNVRYIKKHRKPVRDIAIGR